MITYIKYIGYLSIIIGLFITFISALGILRFSDFFTKLHPAGLADSLGVPAILFGLALAYNPDFLGLKLILLILLLWISSTTSCYALASAVFQKNTPKNISSDLKKK